MIFLLTNQSFEEVFLLFILCSPIPLVSELDVCDNAAFVFVFLFLFCVFVFSFVNANLNEKREKIDWREEKKKVFFCSPLT